MEPVDPGHRKLIRKAAREAADYGIRADLWHTFRATVEGTGVPVPTALRLLNREALHFYSRFCFAEGMRDEGLRAYEALLERNGDDAGWLAGTESGNYLAAVRETRGPAGLIEAFGAFARIGADVPSLQRLVADAEAELGHTDAALARMEAVVARHHTEGEYHAALARHAADLGRDELARRHLIAAAKRGVVADLAFFDFPRLGVDTDLLNRVAAEHAVKDADSLLEDFVRRPGLTLLPAGDADSDADAPHVYGGDGGFELPNCPNCGRTILLLGALDAAAAAAREPTLAPLVGTLPRLPILHCDNCQLMFSTPDYRVSEDGRRVEVYNVVLPKDGRTTFDSDKHPAAQRAKLVAPDVPAVAPGEDPWEAADYIDRQRADGPQVGGTPRPINEPRRRFCPRCDAEQIFYAAVCETGAFATPIVVNPDGYCYWFACPACRILSTDLDNT